MMRCRLTLSARAALLGVTALASGVVVCGPVHAQSGEDTAAAAGQKAQDAAETVVVTGRKPKSPVVINPEPLTAQAPPPQSPATIAMKAPTRTRGPAGFLAAATYGGGILSDNTYSIDGLNISNPETYATQGGVPYAFFQSTDDLGGGHPAHIGRATGTVVEATTQPGGNAFTFAVHGSLQPASWRDRQVDTYQTDGRFERSRDASLSAEGGGALIRDRLFVYGFYQLNNDMATSAVTGAGGVKGLYSRSRSHDPFVGGRIDGYLSANQHLWLTAFDTRSTTSTDYSWFDGGVGAGRGRSQTRTGGVNWVANYAGQLSDSFSVSASAGVSQDRYDMLPGDTSANNVLDYRSGRVVMRSTEPLPMLYRRDTARHFVRAEGEWRFEALGSHHLRFGIDDENLSDDKVQRLTGPDAVQYRYRNLGGADRVELLHTDLAGQVRARNRGAYVEDSWDLTAFFNAQFGLRSDGFRQTDGTGRTYVDLAAKTAPRLGFTWAPRHDGRWTLYGSAGRTYLAPSLAFGFRGDGLSYGEYFSAPAGGFVIDPVTAKPAALGAPYLQTGFTSPCPGTGLAACAVYDSGATIQSAQGVKSTYQDEVLLGASYKINDLWTAELTVVHATTHDATEDSDFTPAFVSYLTAHGLDASGWAGQTSYYIWNPGDHDVTVTLNRILPGETAARTVTLSAAQLGHFPEAKRDYGTVSASLRRTFDGSWGLSGSYTWTRLRGNYLGVEGGTGDADLGDGGEAYQWDTPGLVSNATGALSGDRTHTLRVWGSYAITPDLILGGDVTVQSPVRLSCLGLNPADPLAYAYGPVSHVCGGVASPASEGPRTEWKRNVDMSLRYAVPGRIRGSKLTVRADITNLLDTHRVTARHVTYDYGETSQRDAYYGQATDNANPRALRLGFDLNY